MCSPLIYGSSLKDCVSESAKQNPNKIKFKKIPWSAKKFYDDAPSPAQEASLSKALHSLGDRGLVTLYDVTNGNGIKPRTTHVKLTKAGEKIASIGMTKRQLAIHHEMAVLRNEIVELRKFKNAFIEARMLQHDVRPSVSIPPIAREIVGWKKSTPTGSWPSHREEYYEDFGSPLWIDFEGVYCRVAEAIRKRVEKVGDNLEPDEVADSEMFTYEYIEAIFPTDPIDPNITITG